MRVNVIGHITSGIGLGVMACDLMQALLDLGHEVAGYDLDSGGGRQGRAPLMQRYVRRGSRMFRDGVDLYVLPLFALEAWRRLYHFGSAAVAYPLWELRETNPHWIRALKRFDWIVSPSDFIGDTLEAAGAACLPQKMGSSMRRAKHPHYGAAGVRADRAAFGLPEDRVVFTFSFDPSSDSQRKNPQAVFEAFERANVENGLLCLQINRCKERSVLLENWLRRLPAGHVTVIDRYLSHEDTLRLLASSDVYISLHRAEGLGLGMLEAMQLGKPVIATKWSGNLSFMDDASAELIGGRLARINGSIPFYDERIIGGRAYWFEPNVEQAARAIRDLAGDADLRRDLGRRAQISAEMHQAEARRLDWLEVVEPQPGRAALGHYERMEFEQNPKFVAVENINVNAHGRFLRLRRDMIVALSEEEAEDLLRIGAVKAVDPQITQINAER